MTKKSEPSWLPRSWIGTMAGWSICATIWASRWNRSSASFVRLPGGMSLTATSRFRTGSFAR